MLTENTNLGQVSGTRTASASMLAQANSNTGVLLATIGQSTKTPRSVRPTPLILRTEPGKDASVTQAMIKEDQIMAASKHQSIGDSSPCTCREQYRTEEES